MTPYGSCFPLNCGGYVVTIYVPNEGAKERLMAEIGRIEADAFAPAIALADGYPATGGGNVTHVAEMPEAPPLPPSIEALVDRAVDAEAATDSLKHGEAYMGEATANRPLNLPGDDAE